MKGKAGIDSSANAAIKKAETEQKLMEYQETIQVSDCLVLYIHLESTCWWPSKIKIKIRTLGLCPCPLHKLRTLKSNLEINSIQEKEDVPLTYCSV